MSDDSGSFKADQVSQSPQKSATDQNKFAMLRPSLLKSGVGLDANCPLEETLDRSDNHAVNILSQPNSSVESTKSEKQQDSSNILKRNCPSVSVLAATIIPLSNKSDFVFGQNIHERVVGENVTKSTPESCSNETSGSNENINSNMFFSTALSHVNTPEADAATPQKETDIKCLTEVARVYQESKAQKRKYDAVETFTGEEEEINVVELNCKLFTFVNGNWEELGRGILRLNDSKDKSYSRIVFRASGSLRLLLNTKMWPEMVLQRPSDKSIRFTAMDNLNQIKIYLLMTRTDDINVLYNSLSERVHASEANECSPNKVFISSKAKENDNNDETNAKTKLQ